MSARPFCPGLVAAMMMNKIQQTVLKSTAAIARSLCSKKWLPTAFIAVAFGFSLLNANISREFHKKSHERHEDFDVPRSILSATDPFPFSACLLTKDDIRILPEWLAYHYTVMPLRHLIVAIDPLSLTSPISILDKFRELGMNITVWEDKDFNDDKNKVRTPYDTPKEIHKAHQRRQLIFYNKCLTEFMDRNHTWTMLVDTDEYLIFNYYQKDERTISSANASQISSEQKLRTLLPRIGTMTVAQYLAKQGTAMEAYPCLTFPRIFFGAQESTPQEIALKIPDGFDPLSFSTARFRYCQSGSGRRKTLAGKSIVHAARFGGKKITNVHSAIKRSCLPPHAFPAFSQSDLRVQHYTGSLEFYARYGQEARGFENFNKRNAFVQKTLTDDSIRDWLQAFIDIVGLNKSLEVTETLREWAIANYSSALTKVHEGNFTYPFYYQKNVAAGRSKNQTFPVTFPVTSRFYSATSFAESKNDNSTTCALIFFGLPRSFSSKAFPTIQQHILNINPTCDVFVHSYNVTVALGNRMGELSGNTIDVSEIFNFTQYYSQKDPVCELMLETEEEFQRQRNLTYFRSLFPRPTSWEYPISIDNMIRQWHSIDSGWKLLTSFEKKMLKRYERVGFFRLDVIYMHPINILTNESAVIPPLMFSQGLKNNFLNDRLFYGDRDIGAIWASERFDSVDEFISWKMSNKDKVTFSGLHSEEMLRFLLIEKYRLSANITLRNICFQRVRTTGKVLTHDCDIFGNRKSGDQPARGLFVLGSPGSATLFLTSLLVHGLGYKSPGELAFANDTTLYENTDISSQNNIWLKEQGTTWDELLLRPSPINSSNITEGFMSELSCATKACLSSTLVSQSQEAQYFMRRDKALSAYNDPSNFPWVMMEPLLCFTLKFWIEILSGATPAVIYTYQNPLEAAQTLKSRQDSYSLVDGLKLWIRYNRIALENSKDLCRVVASNEAIMQNPMQEMRRIKKELESCGLPIKKIDLKSVRYLWDKKLMHSPPRTNGTDCAILRFPSDEMSIASKGKEKEMYELAMNVYCDLEKGKALRKDYIWPE